MSKKILARTAALSAAAVLALSACGGTDEAPEDDAAADPGVSEQDDRGGDASDAGGAEDASDDASEDEDSEEESPAEDDDADAPSGEVTEVEIGTEFTDEETGDVITIVSAVRGNDTEYWAASDNPDGEMIYLEVHVVPGDQFGGTISISSFFLDDDGSEANYANVDDEVEAAGYEYFDMAPRRDGEHTGYVPIYVETTADTLQGSYVRPEAKVLGDDTVIPEFTGEFEVPSS